MKWLDKIPFPVWIALGLIALPLYLLYFAYVLRPAVSFWAPIR